MKNTSKSASKSRSLPSRVSVENKARLSTMTAFSFGKQQVIDQSNTFKKGSFMVFFLCFTSQNETANSSLMLPIIISVKPKM
jgi:hypothetical protein